MIKPVPPSPLCLEHVTWQSSTLWVQAAENQSGGYSQYPKRGPHLEEEVGTQVIPSLGEQVRLMAQKGV